MILPTSTPMRLSLHLPFPDIAIRETRTVPGWGQVFTEGEATLLDRPGVAVIGSRRAPHRGRAIAAEVAAQLVAQGLVVISGLAAGIDKAAHEAAMRAGGRTIAVLGTSLDEAYPRHHAALQARIASEHLVISPFAHGTPMGKWHFPRRNRVMARLARATILIEAGATSGTKHELEECIAARKPIFVYEPLLRERIEWLNDAYACGRMCEWRDPREVALMAASCGPS
jgi:DNA protecting protein DprA